MPVIVIQLATWLGGKLLGKFFGGAGASGPGAGYLIIVIIIALAGGAFFIKHKIDEAQDAHERIGQLRSDLALATSTAERNAAEAQRIEQSYKDQLEQLTRQQRELATERSQIGTAVRRSNDAARTNDPICGGVCDAFFDSLRVPAGTPPAPGNAAGPGRSGGLPAGVPGPTAPAATRRPYVRRYRLPGRRPGGA